ncbi:hypothetical protein TOPH_08108 [Tolypocladium ophioglossoides CBS 100239]|uniref:Uncharacterized protein n=1 Tax=Tolypocladium ophioglossoides (strain CBS 100239) TaxID=1163406 RepID=A0A0L0MZM5_TOLOC|nr:hypothetical protein TOPH_08108 [Tolypocladium ophioglossoides CBS 100239]
MAPPLHDTGRPQRQASPSPTVATETPTIEAASQAEDGDEFDLTEDPFNDGSTSATSSTDPCNLRKDWGVGKYTLLLVVPSTPSIRSMRNSQKHQLIEKLRSRLADDCDPLEGWLDQARGLCCAIVNRELPAKNLTINVYYLKQHDTIGDNEYGAYTSLDPREKTNIPLSRLQHTFDDDGAFYFSTKLVTGVRTSYRQGAAVARCYAKVAPIRHPQRARPDAAMCSQPARYIEIEMQHLLSLKEKLGEQL